MGWKEAKSRFFSLRLLAILLALFAPSGLEASFCWGGAAHLAKKRVFFSILWTCFSNASPEALSEAKILSLLRQLSSPSWPKRHQAFQKLKQAMPQARPVLEKYLQKATSAELKDKIQQILFLSPYEFLCHLYATMAPNGNYGNYHQQFATIAQTGRSARKAVLFFLNEQNLTQFLSHSQGSRNEKNKILYLTILAAQELRILEAKAPLAKLYKARSQLPAQERKNAYLELIAAVLKTLGEPKYFDQLVEKHQKQIQSDPQNPFAYEKLALLYSYAQDHPKTIRFYHKAIQKFRQQLLRSRSLYQTRLYISTIPNFYYNLACAYAMSQKKFYALAALAKAFFYGYRDLQWLKKDKDLDPIRSCEDFKTLQKFLSFHRPISHAKLIVQYKHALQNAKSRREKMWLSYFLASLYGIKQQTKEGINALQQAAQYGWKDYSWLELDPDLSAIVQSPEYRLWRKLWKSTRR
ncbi:MAG: hypothetical protein D6805_04530 [Planctomycetota bacterium]|nr:MAG: hypothetical protein D6805_04530 [Planctomycetota bacterium]